MKAFRFSLESVLSYRRQVEEMRKREFALALRAAQEQQAALHGFYADEARAKEELRDIERRFEVADMLAQRRWLAALARRIAHARDLLRQRTEAQVKARGAYVQARRATRVLERLRERRKEDWSLQVTREEAKLMDEVAAATRGAAEGVWNA